jgi:AP-1 complex subunit mu
MVLSSLYFLDARGRILIGRDYRGDVPFDCAEGFMELLNDEQAGRSLLSSAAASGPEAESNEESIGTPPILTKDGVTYCYVEYNNLYGIEARFLFF